MCCTCNDVADQGGGDGWDGEGWMRSGGVKGSNSLLNINLFNLCFQAKAGGGDGGGWGCPFQASLPHQGQHISLTYYIMK